MFEDIYRQIGLSKEESEIYQSLLENGALSASELAKTTSVKRTYIYTLVQDLVRKGLVIQEKRGRVTTFVAQSPDKLLELTESRKNALEQTRQALENVLPSLKSLYTVSGSKPIMTYFEGLEGIKKVYLDTLKEGKDIDALVETSKVEPEVYAWLTREYAPRRVKMGINVRAIVASGVKTEKYVRLNEAELRETRQVESKDYPFEHEINIYGSKLAIINHRKGYPLLGLIIDHPVVAKTFQSWFELTWSSIA